MNSFDATRLMELQTQIAATQADLVLAREQLIERLGDCLCGNPGGRLTRVALKVLARASRNAAVAQRKLAQFLTGTTLATLVRSTGTPGRPSCPPGNGIKR